MHSRGESSPHQDCAQTTTQLVLLKMERAFELWESGEYPKKKDGDDEKEENTTMTKRRSLELAPAFGGEPWIARTAGYVGLAQGLDEEEHWPQITAEAEAHLSAGAAAAAAASQPDIDVRATLSLW